MYGRGVDAGREILGVTKAAVGDCQLRQDRQCMCEKEKGLWHRTFEGIYDECVEIQKDDWQPGKLSELFAGADKGWQPVGRDQRGFCWVIVISEQPSGRLEANGHANWTT